jgi:hypothetical protein
MKLNKALFLDIEKALTRTNSGREFPLHIADWKFNDDIIKYIKKQDFDFIILIGNRKISEVFDKKVYKKFIDLVYDTLYKIINTPIYIVYSLSKDTYLNFPNPGSIFTICIENDISLSNSIYIGSDKEAIDNSCAGIQILYSDFIG